MNSSKINPVNNYLELKRNSQNEKSIVQKWKKYLGSGPCLEIPCPILKVSALPRTRAQEIILDGGMGALLTSVEVDSSPIWSGIANINSREVVIDAHQVKFG